MKVLFICYANVCRSFMAQELLKTLLPEATVFSRGLYADPACPVPAKVLAFLSKQGLSPAPHTPAPLRTADLEAADLILLMEQRHLEYLSDRYAQYSGKMWLLNDFAHGKETDVPDPISLSGRDFDKSARQLLQTVKAAADKLHRLHPELTLQNAITR